MSADRQAGLPDRGLWTPRPPFFDDRGVNHSSFNIFVAKEFLNSSDVIAIFSVIHTYFKYMRHYTA